MAAARAYPKIDRDSLGAARFQAECLGFGARHVLAQIEGDIALGVFGPVAARPLTEATAFIVASRGQPYYYFLTSLRINRYDGFKYHISP